MLQHLINALLGLVLILIALVASSTGILGSGLGWTLGIVGLAVSASAIWGLFDEMANQSPLEYGIDSER